MVSSKRPNSTRRRSSSFNPLHCGAVVSSVRQTLRSAFALWFQSPSLRGSGLFKPIGNQADLFPIRFQSPSLRGSGLFRRIFEGLGIIPVMFQSPSLRGSGLFRPFVVGSSSVFVLFQSPSLRGSGLFDGNVSRLGREAHLVSIPFIAGQWSLQGRADPGRPPGLVFQSPSLRGSGRFRPGLEKEENICPSFQSPSLRGSGRFMNHPCQGGNAVIMFQSPSLRGSGRFWWARRKRNEYHLCFNPLHCGAVVASLRWRRAGRLRSAFQSPSLRGSGRF